MQINSVLSAYPLFSAAQLPGVGAAARGEASELKADKAAAIADVVDLSPEAEALLKAETTKSQTPLPSTDPVSNAAETRSSDAAGLVGKTPANGSSTGPSRNAHGKSSAQASSPTGPSSTHELSEEEQAQVEQLKARDTEVRTHEQAHLAAAGPYARGGPSYTYQKGPDGKRYAIGGEVGIDTSPVEGDPEATVAKARVIRSAAVAPAEPSSQDRAVAAAAVKMEQDALSEIRNKEESAGQATEDTESQSRPNSSFKSLASKPRLNAYSLQLPEAPSTLDTYA